MSGGERYPKFCCSRRTHLLSIVGVNKHIPIYPIYQLQGAVLQGAVVVRPYRP